MPVQQTCTITGETFTVSDRELEIASRIGVPMPNLSPLERIRRSKAQRNEWKLYHRKCDKSGDPIISAYHDDVPFPVYKNEIWWGDTWTALDYGREIDFNRPFLDQYRELLDVVPREGTSIFDSENSEYNSHVRESRNCYLNSLAHQCEDVCYSYWTVRGKDNFDSQYSISCSLLYWSSHVQDCYKCIMLEESQNCNECHFSYQLKGCDHCLFSTNLVNKSYHIFNKPCTKEEYEDLKSQIFTGSYQRWQQSHQKFLEVRAQALHRSLQTNNIENVRGDHVFNCRNSDFLFEAKDCEDCSASASLGASRDIYGSYSAGWPSSELVWDSAITRGSTDIAFCTNLRTSTKLRYCDSCISCEDCFLSVGVRHQKYCILNKQYSESEYHDLVAKIVAQMKSTGEWGTMPASKMNVFAYNESAAQDFYPLNERQAAELGYTWRERDHREYQPPTIAEIPDSIHDVDDSICDEVLACSDTGKNYKIIPRELKFYREHNLPIPRQCPERRHRMRFSLNNPLRLWQRSCDLCQKVVESSYAPDRPEKVACEECYLKEVY